MIYGCLIHTAWEKSPAWYAWAVVAFVCYAGFVFVAFLAKVVWHEAWRAMPRVAPWAVFAFKLALQGNIGAVLAATTTAHGGAAATATPSLSHACGHLSTLT